MVLDQDALLSCAMKAARAAGGVLAPRLGRPGGIREKASGLVTDADLEAERAIVAAIRSAFPDHAILSEEMGSEGSSPARWIIDPLDGTHNFIRGVPWYDVSIAFERNGAVEVGAVFAPSLDLLFATVQGRGARLNGHPITASSRQSLAQSFVDVGFSREDWMNPALAGRVARLAEAGTEIRSLNACGLDLAYVAAGWLDAYWDLHVSLWDVAAGGLLVTEAGGRLLTRASAGDPSGRMMVLASNAHLHAPLRDILEIG